MKSLGLPLVLLLASASVAGDPGAVDLFAPKDYKVVHEDYLNHATPAVKRTSLARTNLAYRGSMMGYGYAGDGCGCAVDNGCGAGGWNGWDLWAGFCGEKMRHCWGGWRGHHGCGCEASCCPAPCAPRCKPVRCHRPARCCKPACEPKCAPKCERPCAPKCEPCDDCCDNRCGRRLLGFLHHLRDCCRDLCGCDDCHHDCGCGNGNGVIVEGDAAGSNALPPVPMPPAAGPQTRTESRPQGETATEGGESPVIQPSDESGIFDPAARLFRGLRMPRLLPVGSSM
jgi:hypothetical protein